MAFIRVILIDTGKEPSARRHGNRIAKGDILVQNIMPVKPWRTVHLDLDVQEIDQCDMIRYDIYVRCGL